MAVLVEIGGSVINPLNVQVVEISTEVREIRRENLPALQETAHVINITMRDGLVKSVEAVSKDPTAHDALLKEVVHTINVGLNTNLHVVS